MTDTMQDMVNTIMTLDANQLRKISEALTIRRDSLARVARMDFSVGDIVTFTTSRKRGRHAYKTVTGPIQRINRKNIIVLDSKEKVRWTVPPTMLTKVEE